MASQFFRNDDRDRLRYFARERVDMAVLEVGHGRAAGCHQCGRAAGQRHCRHLARSSEISGQYRWRDRARESGIIRPGGVVVTLPQQPAANDVIGNTILDLDAVG